ncbi:MAG TPA: TonB-dependent receptor, partial [Gemmatimonadaceae bacterium]
MRTLLLLACAPAIMSAQSPDSTTRDSSTNTRKLETVTVSAIRARNDAPVAAKTLDAAELQRRSFGQDVPIMLQGTPSLTSYAETANYWGYSYIRMRGIDQSRINLTLDGIPLNDPEDQVLYFTDFPDLTASLGSVQVQRGVGTSAPGSASYGGSINFQTTPLTSSTLRNADVQLQAGSFGTLRGSAEYASGLSGNGLAAYGRISAIRSGGYRRHSGVDARSGFMSVGWVGNKDVVKLTATAGLFADTMAYVGATRAELAADERTNALRPDETDRFGEQLVALSHTRDLGNGASIANTLYRISAKGNYDVCIASCATPTGNDNWNFHLDFAWLGATSVANFNWGDTRITTGVNANTYARDHDAFDRGAGMLSLYTNTGRKRDASVFAKFERDLGKATLFADVQGRRAQFSYQPDVAAGIQRTSIGWNFLNPKVGATYRLTPSLSAFASYGVNGREPARNDMLAGFDNISASDSSAIFVGPLSRVRPERVRDTELGLRKRAAHWSLDGNLFAMEFRDEILPVGQLSYIGTPLRTNVPSSWRRGIELDGSAEFDRLRVGATTTLMRARISSFTDATTSILYKDVAPLLTPEFTATHWATMQLS